MHEIVNSTFFHYSVLSDEEFQKPKDCFQIILFHLDTSFLLIYTYAEHTLIDCMHVLRIRV